MLSKIECVEKETVPVLSIRTRTPVANLSQVIGSAYQAIGGYIGSMGEEPAGAPFVAYYNMDMNDLDIELGFPVKKLLEGKENIQPGEIPAGKQVSCLYTGPYEQIMEPYDKMAEWIKQNDLTPVGTSYEFYLNGPNEVPPEELQTIIMFPVK